MSAQTILSGGDKWYSYSGMIFGDVSAPATIQMIFVPNTGLRDSLVHICPFYGKEVTTTSGKQLGILIKLDDVEVYKAQGEYTSRIANGETIPLLVPRQSKLEVISLNVSENNTQTRGCNLVGYYI